MKVPYALGLVLVAVVITVVVEESRIAKLRDELRLARSSGPTEERGVSPRLMDQDGGVSQPRGRAVQGGSVAERVAKDGLPQDSDEASMAKTVRKMWDNPAGKAMMNQGVKIAVAMMYENFIEGLDLTKEESDYFKTLLGAGMASQQEFGMKLMGASPEEREQLIEEMKKRGEEEDAAIQTFLNSEQDYEAYTHYKERLHERQQMDGIRATMESKGAPLDADTEARLVETMYKVRTESKGADFSGPEAFEEMAKGNMVERFEKHWDRQQEVLRAETSGFLSPAQQEAFEEYQKNLKEMQMMGLKMAEKMMNQKGGGAE